MTLRPITLVSILLRLLLAILIGGIMGIEREKKNRPAGLRTYMLVCVGSCLIMLTNQYLYQTTGAGDPMRLGAQVISGIGFLGAGTIIVTKRNQIKGLTTAAGLWTAAGIGLALGVGFYEAALIAAGAIFLILSVFHRLDAGMHRAGKLMELYIEYDSRITMGGIIRALRELGLKVDSIQPENDSVADQSARGVILTAKLEKRRDHTKYLEKIRAVEGILYLEEL